MGDIAALASAVAIICLSVRFYNEEAKRSDYEPLKRAGLLKARVGTHLYQAIFRDKRDPLRGAQMKLAIYGLKNMATTFTMCVLSVLLLASN
jgi:hypothetical protein